MNNIVDDIRLPWNIRQILKPIGGRVMGQVSDQVRFALADLIRAPMRNQIDNQVWSENSDKPAA